MTSSLLVLGLALAAQTPQVPAATDEPPAAAAAAEPAAPAAAAEPAAPAAAAEPAAAPSTITPASEPLPADEPHRSVDAADETSVPLETDVSGAAPASLGVLPRAGGQRRSGLYGWGIGLELPMIGVMSGAAQKSDLGAGYTLGGAISWEATPSILARLYVSGGTATNGRARVSYTAGGVRQEKRPVADWLNLEAGLGAAYLFRDDSRAWSPYVGVDAGVAFCGYEYAFDDDAELVKLESDVDYASEFEEGGHFGTAFGFTAGLRAGLRLDLTAWLSTIAEINASYARVGDGTISNTLQGPDVRSEPEAVVLMRGSFSVRLAL